MRYARLIGLCLLAMVPGVRAMGGTLNLYADPKIQEHASNLGITYTFGSPGLLSIKATNAVATITTNGGSTFTTYLNSFFDIEAHINTVTGQAIDATISFQIHYPTPGSALTTVFSSSTLDTPGFGYSSDFRELDFRFIQSGASVAPGVHDGTPFGIAVFALNGYNTGTPVWGANFSGTGAKADAAAAVPLPQTVYAGVALLGLLAAGACLLRLRGSTMGAASFLAG